MGSWLYSLIPLGLLQTGALIYFAGQVSRTLRDHDKAIDAHEGAIYRRETRCEECGRTVAVLANKAGLS